MASRANSLAKIVNHVNSVAEVYWELFTERGKVLVAEEQLKLAASVVETIEKRSEFDAEKNLVFQARAALDQRQVAFQQAMASAKLAQDRFVRLIGNAGLMDTDTEIITSEPAIPAPIQLDLQNQMAIAVAHRPEVQQAITDIRASNLLHHLTLNQLLPRLTFDLEASLNGLDGDYDVGTAFGQQFDASPSYEVGLNFEVPINNMTARFRNREAELAIERFRATFRNTIEGVQLDVKSAFRRLEYLGGTLASLESVIQNTKSELGIIVDRTFVAPRRDDLPSIQLNQLLNAQERLAGAKVEFLESLAIQQRSLIDMRRATGQLVSSDILHCDTGPNEYDRHCLAQTLRAVNEGELPEIQAVTNEIRLRNRPYAAAQTQPATSVFVEPAKPPSGATFVGPPASHSPGYPLSNEAGAENAPIAEPTRPKQSVNWESSREPRTQPSPETVLPPTGDPNSSLMPPGTRYPIQNGSEQENDNR